MKRTLKVVDAIDIRIDGETQQRDSIDPHWVHEMVDNMKNDVEYPPLHVRYDGAHYWLSDGFHRYHAYTQLGINKIEVAYLPGTQFDAQIDSYSANHDHGKPRSRAPIAISTITGRIPLVEMTIIASCGPNLKPFRISSAYPSYFSRWSGARRPFVPTMFA